MGLWRDLIRCRLLAAQRQSNRKDGAAPRSIAGCADGATEQGNQPLYYEQAEAETTLASMDYPGVLHQWVEYFCNQSRRDSGTVVAHFNNPLVGARFHRERHMASARCELHRVQQQVADDLPHARGVEM